MNIDVTEQKQAERERERLVHDLGERVKELRLLHAVARLLQSERPFNLDLLTELVALMPPAWQYPECCAARIAYGGIEAITPGWQAVSLEAVRIVCDCQRQWDYRSCLPDRETARS